MTIVRSSPAALDVCQLFGASRLRAWDDNPAVVVLDDADPFRTPGITEQFLKDAQLYHDRYFKPSRYHGMLDRALATVEWAMPRNPLILDFGSGSGNTMIPLLQMRRDSRVVAADLSVDLLQILHRLLAERSEFAGRFACVCGDLDTSDLGSGIFDMVVGAAILHHLLHPRRALQHALAALKPGGAAIFFEPFEYGCLLLNFVYLTLLDKARIYGPLPPPAGTHFQAMVRDFNARFDAGTEKPHTPYLDDKWLFTREFFLSVADDMNCRQAIVINSLVGPELKLSGYLKLTMQRAGLCVDSLPEWAVQELARIEGGFSDDFMREAIIEGTVILVR